MVDSAAPAPAGETPLPPPAREVVLVSNRVMHYRVSVYNYFWQRFREHGWNFRVVADQLQSQNRNPPRFDLRLVPFGFLRYRRELLRTSPDAVILFLHLRDRFLWPLIHWLKLARIPFAAWTKTRNLDALDDHWRNLMFDYVNRRCDALILYTGGLRRYIPARDHNKVFLANNTINFTDFPSITESKNEIKRDLGIPFAKVVLFVGRIGEERNRKKVDHLIEMFRDLQREDLGLVIVGSGLDERLRSRMNPNNTRYLGEVHDSKNLQIARIFTMSDICSIPGHVGLGLNQAFFFGLPVVTEHGCQPPEIEYLVDGRNGFIVPEDDRHALAHRILQLADDDELRLQFSRNARADILDHASIEKMFDGFLKCAEYLSAKHPRQKP